MLFADILKWWYTPGFSVLLAHLKVSFQKTLDHFSFGTLLGTLFAPFRQIDANTGGRTLAEKFQAWFGRLISRFVGFLVRIFLLILGLIVLLVKAVVSLLWLILWPLAPILPVVFVVCAIAGVGV